MNFPRRNNNRKLNLVPFIVVIFLIIIFSFSGTRNLIFSIGSPFWHIKNSISIFFSDSGQLVRSKSSLIEENNLLKEQIKKTEEDILLSKIIQGENDDLKSLLNRKPASQKQILAVVLDKPFLSPYDTLIIDAGSSNGISIGDKVLADEGTFIGSVSEAFDNKSKVILYSSPGEKIKVLIGNNNMEKEATGVGGGNFVLEAPKEAGIKEGDTIIIPSISPNVFGVVEKISSKETDSLETVLFKNPINISELKWVLVLPSKK